MPKRFITRACPCKNVLDLLIEPLMGLTIRRTIKDSPRYAAAINTSAVQLPEPLLSRAGDGIPPDYSIQI